MQFPESYVIDNKIKSISSYLNYIAKDRNSSKYYVESEIKLENLRYNFSNLITKIILNFSFIERGKTQFLIIIDEYNLIHNTTLTFENFESINWIIETGDEIIIPELIRYSIWKIQEKNLGDDPLKIDSEFKDLIGCLQLYYDRYYKNANLLITKRDLRRILKDNVSKEITIRTLLEKGIVVVNKKNASYSWVAENEYTRHLSEEIAATLWSEIGGVNAGAEDFKRYYKLLRGAGIWPRDLVNFIPQNSLQKLRVLAADYLYSENDLKKSTTEFRKIWLNSRNNYRDILTEIPSIQFNYDDQYSFIGSIKNTVWKYRDIFEYQHSRNYNLLLRLIIENEPLVHKPYDVMLKILQTMDMPIILWNVYEEIPQQFPQIIPYLLQDTNLIPLAFNLVDQIEISEIAISGRIDNERKYEISREEISKIWIEMFDLLFERIESISGETKIISVLLARILSDHAEKVFSSNGKTSNNISNHNILRKRYYNVIRLIETKRFSNSSMPGQNINPRIIFYYLPEITNHIIGKLANQKSGNYPYLKINSGLFDLAIKTLKLLNLKTSEAEISGSLIKELEKSSHQLINALKEALDVFYNIKDIKVQTYDGNAVEIKKASRNAEEFGFEIIEWGFLFLHLEQLNLLTDIDKNAISSLDFLTTGDKYDAQNIEQANKLKLYIKSIMLAFKTINENKDDYDLLALPTVAVLSKLEQWIKKYATEYSKDDIANQRIDIFNDRYNTFGYDLYYQHLTELLFNCVPYFKAETQEEFVREYLSGNTDISRILSASNILESKKLQDIISERLSQIDFQEYIEGRLMITDLQYALIEAVNSENHLVLAESLLNEVQQHFSHASRKSDKNDDFLFEINLLLAFKQNDYEKFETLEVPKRSYRIAGDNKKGERLKLYFKALFNLYNDHEYDEAIVLLTSLQADEPKKIHYAYQIYKAQTLKAINSNDKKLLFEAYQRWENFLGALNDEEKVELKDLEPLIASNNLFHLYSIKDALRFDQTINKLSTRHLYNQEIIPIVYNYYNERDLFEAAYDYITKAEQYLHVNEIVLMPNVENLIINASSKQLLKSLKNSFVHIRSLKPEDLAAIVPDILNDKRKLSEFVLHEVVQAGKVVIEKIHAIKQITHEDRYNDLLLAILRLRFPIWGWEITDQARIGSSPTGSSAGEVDLIIKAGGTTVTLFEALILSGKDKTLTQTHVKKITTYASFLDRYYMIVYYTGKPDRFNTTWESYKNDAKETSFDSKFTFDIVKGYEDLSNNFTNVTSLKIAKSTHGSSEIFHVMIDLSR